MSFLCTITLTEACCNTPDTCTVLCEQGNLQVFYQDLPLSIQDGYERFLSSSTVSLQQYQVRVRAESCDCTSEISCSTPLFHHQGVWASEETGVCGAQVWSQVTESLPYRSVPCLYLSLLSECVVVCVLVLTAQSHHPMRGSWTCLSHMTEQEDSWRGSAASVPPQHPGKLGPRRRARPDFIFLFHF